MATESRRETTSRERSGRRLPTRPGLRPTFPPPDAAPVTGLDAPVMTSLTAVASVRPVPEIVISHEAVLEGEDAEALWELYEEAMGPLNEVAAMNHADSQESMLKTFAEPGITKIVAWVDAVPIALGMITADFDLVPEASSSYFENRFPDHFASGTLFYGMSVLVKPNSRGLTVFSRIYIEMWQIPAQVGGVLIFDICKFNRDNFGADDIVDHVAANFPRSSWSIIDQQSWYAAEIPEALP